MFNARTGFELPNKVKIQPIGPIGVLDATPIIEATSAHPGIKLRAMMKWSMAYQPELLISSLRYGLPVWMAYQAVQRGWPLTLVVGPNQVSRAPSDRQPLLLELWALATNRIVLPSIEARDTMIAGLAPLLTIDHVLNHTTPKDMR